MDAIVSALASLLGKITDPVVIVLLILLAGSEWLRMTQSREERADRNLLIAGLKEITEALNELKITIVMKTGTML